MSTTDILRDLIENRKRACNLDLHAAQLAGANLDGLVSDGLDLHNADLRGARLRESRSTSCNMESVRLDGSDYILATLRMCVLDNAQAAGAVFEAARLEDSTAEAADFSRANFRGAHLTETSFARAVLRDAVLDNADGQGVEFRGADLRGASLIGVQFDEADFRGADLRGANLAQGRFHSADFRGALLDGVDFGTADCTGALFDRGEGPPVAKPSTTPDSMSVDTLGELLASLPGLVAAAENPAGALEQTQSLIGKLAQSAGYSPEHQEALRTHLAGIASFKSPSPELLEHLMSALNSDSDEPPEDLKPFLEPFLKIASSAKSTDELIEMLRAGKDNELSPELQNAIDAILQTGKK
jgi:uncharacterized protein YjbI with pentapeptide repeats